MTEQNYTELGQNVVALTTAQVDLLLQRIADLEQQVAALRHQVALAQGGEPGAA